MTSEERENMIMNVYEVTEYKSTRLGFLKFCGIVFVLFMALLLILGLPGAFVITLILGTAQENANTGWAMQIHTVLNGFWGFFAALLIARFASFMTNGIYNGMLENRIKSGDEESISNMFINIGLFVLPVITFLVFVGVMWYFVTYVPVPLFVSQV